MSPKPSIAAAQPGAAWPANVQLSFHAFLPGCQSNASKHGTNTLPSTCNAQLQGM